MATNKPRITVTLNQEAYEALEQVAKVQGGSMSAVLAEVWEEAAPVMLRVVKLVLEAQAAKAGVGDRIKELATEAELAMLPLAREAVSNMDMFEASIREALKGAQGSVVDASVGGARSDTAHGVAAARKGRGKGRGAQ